MSKIGKVVNVVGRRVDQPLFINKLYKIAPWALVGLNAGFVGADYFKASKENRKKVLIKDLAISAGALGGALWTFKQFLKPSFKITEVGENLLDYARRKFDDIARLEDNVDKLKSKLENVKGRTNRKQVKQKLKKAEEAFEERIETEVKTPSNYPKEFRPFLKKVLEKPKKGISAQEAQKLRTEIFKKIINEDYQKADQKLLKEITDLAEAGKNKPLSHKNVKLLMEKIEKLQPGTDAISKQKRTELMDLIIPKSESGSYKEMFEDLWNLSLTGLFPVLGGMFGGLAGNLINKEPEWKSKFGVQIQEGFYQFFANIMLCNIGAALMLLGLSKAKFIPQNKMTRFGAMIIGIAGAGVLGGATLSNFVGHNFIKPIADDGWKQGWQNIRNKVKDQGAGSLFKNLFDERVQRGLDAAMHVDDLVSLGYVGLKAIGPLIPILYWGSGWLTGQEFRNGKAYRARQEQAKNQLHKTVITKASRTPVETQSLLKTVDINKAKPAVLTHPALSDFQTSQPTSNYNRTQRYQPRQFSNLPIPTYASEATSVLPSNQRFNPYNSQRVQLLRQPTPWQTVNYPFNQQPQSGFTTLTYNDAYLNQPRYASHSGGQ